MSSHQAALVNFARKLMADKGKLDANLKRAKRALISVEAEIACLDKSLQANQRENDALDVLLDERKEALQRLSPSKFSRK